MATMQERRTHTRWAIMRDIPAMVEIDAAASGGGGWDATEMIEGHLRHRNEVGVVIECRDVVVGFMIYRLEAGRLVLLKLAVHPDYQGHGFGSELLYWARRKLTGYRRRFLAVLTPDGSEWNAVGDPRWLTWDVLMLLNGGDDQPPFLLADALQEAGCDDENWLVPLRRGGRFGRAVRSLLVEVMLLGGLIVRDVAAKQWVTP